MVFFNSALKAFFAAAVAALSVLAGYLINSTALGDITAGQWVAVASAALIAGGGVYGIGNHTAAK